MNGWVNIKERLPVRPGSYNVMVEGWRTFLPIYIDSDGTVWDSAETEHHYNGANIYWHPKEGE